MSTEPARAFADLLQDHGPLDFDLEEWLVAFKIGPALEERFRCWTAGAGSIGAHGQAVQTFIRQERHLEVPAYKTHRDCKSSSQFPFLDKQGLRAGGQKFVPEALLSTELWVKSTSGTTGRPVPIYYSPEFHFESFFLTVRKIAALAGVPYDGREVYCVAITDNRECKPFAYPDPCQQVGHFLQTILDGTDSESTGRVLDSLADLRPFCVTVKPSILEALIEYLRNRSEQNFYRPPVLVCSGANLTEALRQNAEAILGVPVWNAYGLTECGIIASECEFHTGLHIWDPDVVVTVVDESGACVPESVAGEIVVSSVRNAAFPLLRYRTGDLGALTTEPCECGVAWPRLRTISGRLVRSFRLPSGRLLSPARFNQLFESFPLVEFQITQRASDWFEAQVEFGRDVTNRSAALKEIEEAIRNEIPERVSIQVSETIFLKQEKFERYKTTVD